MQDSPGKPGVGGDFASMSEKQYENSHASGSGETERRSRPITFDVYVGRIPPDWTKVCV